MNFKSFVPSRERLTWEIVGFVDAMSMLVPMAVLPFVSIWALNTLFSLGLLVDAKTYLAVFYFHSLVQIGLEYSKER